MFDKEKFAELLDKAKGSRSINQYGDEAHISPSHISRFLRCMIDTPPSPETLKKLSSKAYNGVTLNDFMIAVGHIKSNINKTTIDKQDVVDIARSYIYDINNSMLNKELLVKEITEMLWNIKF